MSESEPSQDYIKGFIDALEFVVKSFRSIQFNSQKVATSGDISPKSHNQNIRDETESGSSDKSNSIKDSLDKDYNLEKDLQTCPNCECKHNGNHNEEMCKYVNR